MKKLLSCPYLAKFRVSGWGGGKVGVAHLLGGMGYTVLTILTAVISGELVGFNISQAYAIKSVQIPELYNCTIVDSNLYT